MAVEDIYIAIQNHQMLEIDYTNQKNERSTRTIEPLELRDGKLYAWDIAKDSVRCFFLAPEVLHSVVLLSTTFIPRF